MPLIKRCAGKIKRCRLDCVRQRGSTLIEVLVALLVLSIGLVGLAALQSNGLKFNHSSYLRTQSTILMYDIIDSMRANRSAALDTSCYVVGLSGSVPSCDAVATADINNWKTNLAAQLPSGDGAVALKGGTTGRVYTITVQWEDREYDAESGEPVQKTFSIDAEI